MATTLTNMGLKSWDSPGDNWSYTELAANWTKLDQHDHTSGKGLPIPTGGISNLAVTTGKLANGAVDSTKLKPSIGLFPNLGSFYNVTTSWGNVGSQLSITPSIASYLLVWGHIVGNYEPRNLVFSNIAVMLNVDSGAATSSVVSDGIQVANPGGYIRSCTLPIVAFFSLTAASHVINVQAVAGGTLPPLNPVISNVALSYMLVSQ